jgi:hypothetical protein
MQCNHCDYGGSAGMVVSRLTRNVWMAIFWGLAILYSPQFLPEVSFLFKFCSCHRKSAFYEYKSFSSSVMPCTQFSVWIDGFLTQEYQSTFTRNFSCHKNFCSVPGIQIHVSKTFIWWTQMSSFDRKIILVILYSCWSKKTQVDDFSSKFPVRFQYFLGRFFPPIWGGPDMRSTWPTSQSLLL